MPDTKDVPVAPAPTKEHRRAAVDATYPGSARAGGVWAEHWIEHGTRLRFSDGDSFGRLDRVAQAIALAEERGRLGGIQEERFAVVHYLRSWVTKWLNNPERYAERKGAATAWDVAANQIQRGEHVTFEILDALGFGTAHLDPRRGDAALAAYKAHQGGDRG